MPEEISAAFPFESKFVEVHGSQVHYVEAGEGKQWLADVAVTSGAHSAWRN